MPGPSRRRLFALVFEAAAAATLTAMAPAEARPWGPPPGWFRGCKRGWAKKGGPKRWW